MCLGSACVEWDSSVEGTSIPMATVMIRPSCRWVSSVAARTSTQPLPPTVTPTSIHPHRSHSYHTTSISVFITPCNDSCLAVSTWSHNATILTVKIDTEERSNANSMYFRRNHGHHGIQEASSSELFIFQPYNKSKGMLY